MKRLVIFLAVVVLGTAAATNAAAQTQNVTRDGKATTTRAANGTWDLKVNGRTIASGLASAPTSDPDGTVFIIEKPAGTKTPVDRNGRQVQVQRITQDQIYQETLDRLGIVGEEEAAAIRATHEAKKVAEQARYEARMAAVNPQITDIGEGMKRLSIRGRTVVDGFDIMLLNDKMHFKKLRVYKGYNTDWRWWWDGTSESDYDFRSDENGGYYAVLNKGLSDRYWFYLVDKSYSRERYYHDRGQIHIMDDGSVERYDIVVNGEYDTGLIAVDTETGAYTVLLPFRYDITFTSGGGSGSVHFSQYGVWDQIHTRREGQMGSGDYYRFAGATQLVFQKDNRR